jgi:hypothetical protein
MCQHTETEYLYHYQRFDRKNDRRWLKDTLTKGQIYCSNPRDFNDPWDGKPHLRTNDIHDPTRVEELARYFERVAQPPLPDGPRGVEKRRALRNPSFLTSVLQNMNKELPNEISNTYRVYCLSPFPDINLMWSHYARGHTGICLQFSKRNEVFGAAQRVIYTEELPHCPVDAGEAAYMLLTKSDDWEYEQEHRVIARAHEPQDNTNGRLLITSNNYLTIKKQWLVSLIAGCRSPVTEMQALVYKYSPGLPVKRAVKSPEAYRVTIEDL